VPLLELKHVSSAYGSVEALRGVSLKVDAGEVVTLLGANGAGKSTTLRTISGLIRPTAGEVWFDGQRIDTISAEQIVRLGLSHVPEGRRIFPGLTVRENIMLGSTSRGRLPKRELEEGVEQMFAIFPDIKRFENALGWTLSGGQQQMLAVARGLMAKPKLLLLDEPSLGLAPVIVQQLFATIREIHARGTTILLVEQNAHMALSVASRGYVLETGSLTVEGSTADLLDNEEVRAAYLGGHGA
jgi:branched-chain amino acid transport system ATP-binding protein